MNGIHDLGGMEGLGPLPLEEDEPVFHADWERTAFGLNLAAIGSGYFQVDEVRSMLEQMPPADYLAASYYQKWIWALIELLKAKGVITEAELEAGRALQEGRGRPPVPIEMMKGAMSQPLRADVETDRSPEFAVGDTVRARNMHPHHHTRTPRYARGKLGTVIGVHEAYRLPDANAHGNPDVVERCYTVQFSARELWGEDAPARDSVSLTMFDSYLERP